MWLKSLETLMIIENQKCPKHFAIRSTDNKKKETSPSSSDKSSGYCSIGSSPLSCSDSGAGTELEKRAVLMRNRRIQTMMSGGYDSILQDMKGSKFEIVQKDIGYSSDADMSDACEVCFFFPSFLTRLFNHFFQFTIPSCDAFFLPSIFSRFLSILLLSPAVYSPSHSSSFFFEGLPQFRRDLFDRNIIHSFLPCIHPPPSRASGSTAECFLHHSLHTFLLFSTFYSILVMGREEGNEMIKERERCEFPKPSIDSSFRLSFCSFVLTNHEKSFFLFLSCLWCHYSQFACRFPFFFHFFQFPLRVIARSSFLPHIPIPSFIYIPSVPFQSRIRTILLYIRAILTLNNSHSSPSLFDHTHLPYRPLHSSVFIAPHSFPCDPIHYFLISSFLSHTITSFSLVIVVQEIIIQQQSRMCDREWWIEERERFFVDFFKGNRLRNPLLILHFLSSSLSFILV